MSNFEMITDKTLGEESRGIGRPLKGLRRRRRDEKLEEVQRVADRTGGKPTLCIDRAGFQRSEHAPDKDGACVFCS